MGARHPDRDRLDRNRIRAQALTVGLAAWALLSGPASGLKSAMVRADESLKPASQPARNANPSLPTPASGKTPAAVKPKTNGA